MPLTEQRRKQLDSIVQKMIDNQEPEETIQFVVNDFKQKYGNYPDSKPHVETKITYHGEAPEERSLSGFAGNVLKSGGELIGDVAGAVTHPIQTGKALGNLVLGTAEQVIPGEQSHEQSFDALVNMYAERYGGWENLKKTLYEDPVGALADFSTLIGGGAVAAGSKIPAISKIGQTASRIGRVSDPLAMTAKGLQATAKGLKAPTEAIIGMTTGTGRQATRVALTQNTQAFRDAMRGKIDDMDIVNDAREALDDLRQQRSAHYQQQLSQIKANNRFLHMKPVRVRLESLMGNYRVKVGPEGELDFAASAIGKRDQGDIAEIADLVRNWKDNSILGMDALKRRLDDFYSDSRQSRAFVKGLSKEVKSQLKDVPGYGEMTADYAAASELIKMIDKELSLGQQPGTTVRKLANALNQNNRYRQTILEALDQAGGSQTVEKIAGSALSDVVPRGIIRSLVGGGLIYSAGSGVNVLPAVLLASPRAMGEALTAVSAIKRGVAQLAKSGKYPGAVSYRPATVAAEAEERE